MAVEGWRGLRGCRGRGHGEEALQDGEDPAVGGWWLGLGMDGPKEGGWVQAWGGGRTVQAAWVAQAVGGGRGAAARIPRHDPAKGQQLANGIGIY